MGKYIKYFDEITLSDLPKGKGKDASLDEMFQNLSGKGIAIPDGFALTADAYWKFIEENDFKETLTEILSTNSYIN